MSELEKHRRDWEELAELDPLWAIASTPEQRFGRWDEQEFFATGATQVERLRESMATLGLPARRDAALDFGSGVGRVTRALSEDFAEAVGVDISEGMVAQARELNADRPGCSFVVNAASDLALFEAERFDLVYTRIVLQHLPSADAVKRYLEEFVRVLRPGGLIVAQLATRLPLHNRLWVTRRAYVGLRSLGVSHDVLYRRLRLHPIRMLAVPEARARSWLEESGARILDAERTSASAGREHVTLYATR